MANFDTDIYAQQALAAANGAAQADGNRVAQNIQSARVKRTLTGAETASDFIRLIQLGPGCTLLPHLCAVYSTDPGTTLTGTVGLDTDYDAYSSELTLNAGGLQRFVPTTYPTELLVPTVVWFDITGAASLTADTVVEFDLVWSTRH